MRPCPLASLALRCCNEAFLRTPATRTINGGTLAHLLLGQRVAQVVHCVVCGVLDGIQDCQLAVGTRAQGGRVDHPRELLKDILTVCQGLLDPRDSFEGLVSIHGSMVQRLLSELADADLQRGQLAKGLLADTDDAFS